MKSTDRQSITEKRVAFIGAGNMASSIVSGLLRSGVPAQNITLCDPTPESRKRAANTFEGVHISDENQQATSSDIIVLAVKPQVMAKVCQTLNLNPDADSKKRKPLIISVAAGITVELLESWLATPELAIIRCMPNTPALINQGMTAYYANSYTSDTQRQIARTILAAIGETVEMPQESDLNTVTAVSGSGPAYFFYLMESMIEAGIAQGLTPEVAQQLTLNTALGAAKLALHPSSPDPATLRAQVTSPGGTTEAALNHFQQADMKQTIIEALQAAHDRAVALAEH